MLQAIRQRARGWVAWVIVLLISIPFALFGIQEYFGVSADPVVAVVDGTDIRQSELERRLRDFRATMRRMLGDNPTLFDDASLHRRVLDGMIDEQVLRQAVADWNMQPTDRQIRELIRSIPAFQHEGVFDAALYRTALARQGMTSAFFEQQVRQDIVLRQFETGWQNSHFVTEQKLNDFVRLEAQQRAIRYARIPLRSPRLASVTGEQVNTYYQQHLDDYTIPEQIKLAWLHLSEETLGQQIEPDEETLRGYFAAHQAEFIAPEERRLSHILIAQRAGEAAAQLAQAQALLAQLRAGADFADLARAYSEDPGSAELGGDLGWMEQDAFVQPFAEAAFSLTVGELSEPVQTEFGYHLIRLDAMRGGGQPDFAARYAEVAAAYRAQQVEDLYYDEFERLAAMVYEVPDSLQPAAELLNLSIQQTGWLARPDTFPEPLNTQKIRNMAFSEELLQGNNSELTELGPVNAVVFRVAEHKAAARKGLAAVRDQIVARIAADQAAEQTRQQGEQILQSVRAGGVLAELVPDQALVQTKMLERDTEALPRPVVQAIFTVPGSDQPGYAGVMTDDGYYIVMIERTEDASPALLDAGRVEQYRAQQEARQRHIEYRELRQILRDGMDISINDTGGGE